MAEIQSIIIDCPNCGEIEVGSKSIVGPVECHECGEVFREYSVGGGRDNNEEQFVQKLSPGDDYIIALSVDDDLTDQRREDIMDSIEQIDADRDGNLYAMVLTDGVNLENADKISQDVVQRIADRVIAQLMEAGDDVGETREQTPLGGKTHS